MTVAGHKEPEQARAHAPVDLSRKRGGRSDGKLGYKTRRQTRKRLQHSKTNAVTTNGVRLKHIPAIGVATPASKKKSRTIIVGGHGPFSREGSAVRYDACLHGREKFAASTLCNMEAMNTGKEPAKTACDLHPPFSRYPMRNVFAGKE